MDAHNFLHRNYHALPKLSTSTGIEIGAVYGFTRWLMRLMATQRPQYIAVCFDSAGGSSKRKELFPEYKAHRKPTDEALISQLNLAREVVEKIGLKVYAIAGIEADDIIGFIARRSEAQGAQVVIATSDKDAYQLLGDNIKLWPAGIAKEPLRGPEYVKEKFGIEQKYLIDYLAIVGDSSDNIPGIDGIGPKTAVELINTYGPVENIIKAAQNADSGLKPAALKRILAGQESALMSKRLVTLDDALPLSFTLEDAAVNTPPQAALAELFAKYEFKNLLTSFAPKESAALPESQGDINSGELFAAQTYGIELEDLKHKIRDSIFIQTEENSVIIGVDDKNYSIKDLDKLTKEEFTFISDICNNREVLKISYDVKFTFRSLGVKPKYLINCFDLRLGAYFLNPGADLTFNKLCESFLNLKIDSKTETEFLVNQNALAVRLKEVLERDLKSSEQFDAYNNLEIPLITVLLFMEEMGVLVDKPWLETFSQTLSGELLILQSEIDKLAMREINVNSPKQLGALLFEQFKLPSIKKTKTGYSTDEETLQQLVNLHPVVSKILEYRTNTKLKSTYVDNLILLADDNSRVHTYLDQAGTVTGRLSSSSPNLQNIPVRTPKGRLLRRAFCADPGNVLLSVDYSQIDLRVLAHESGDPVLVNAISEGGDIHTKTAAEVFGVMREMVSDEMRSSAKAINFGIIYGQGPMGLSQTLGISMREAKEYIDGYFAAYQVVKEWIDKNIVLARERGQVKTLLGHVRFLPEFTMGSAQMSSFAQRAAINTIVQGGSADIIKKAMIDIYNYYEGTPVKLLLQVHDELIFELPKEMLASEFPVIKHKMEQAVKLRVPLVAEAKAGANWYEMEKLKL